MVSKKFKLILALLGLIQAASFGQATDANWVYDSSKISTKNMPHYSEFTNYQTPYPAKPRSMWELGIGGGLSMVIGDIDPQAGIGGSLSARKAIGHVVSVRLGWAGSLNYGMDYRLRHVSFGEPDPWQHYEGPNGGGYVANYRAQVHQLSADVLFSLNTINHYRGNPKVDWYTLVGYSYTYTDVDVQNGVKGYDQPVDWSSIPVEGSRSDIRDHIENTLNVDHGLFDMSDDTWKNAPVKNESRANVGLHDGNELTRHAVNVGAGFAFKLSNKINLGIEERITVPFDDNWDGVWAGKSNDILTSTQFRININMGNASNHLEPLWWVNPFNYLYNEVATPRHMKLPPVVLPDADGDGVTDQFDMEPNTPAGCAVDTHGVSLDTDGDGVPDCRDKEKLTPQNCFPVNADGVGACPPDTCCNRLPPQTCNIGSLPSVQFKAGSASLSSTAKSLLDNVASQLQANPECKVKLVGYGASDKRSQQLSWDHVNAIKTYLTEQKGISESRVIFTYGQQGTGTTVDLVPTTEEGPNTVPAPHPNLRKG
jgi:outer membrane protein OmpA-like peptidoglycan-associated protein